MEDDLNGDEVPLRSSQSPKTKQQRLKTLESKTFQTTLKKVKAMKNKICIAEMTQSENDRTPHRNIEIANEIICDCAQQQTPSRKTSHQIVWVFLYLFKVSENDQLLAD